MGKPKAPEAPDPQETAAAQTGTNIATAIANAQINQVDQYTPGGSITYDQIGSTTYTDPATGQTHQIPRFSQTQSLSDGQQRIFDLNEEADTNLAGIASDQTDFLRGYLGTPVNFDNLPGRGRLSDIATEVQSGYNQQSLQGVGSNGPNFNAQSSDAGLQLTGQNQPNLQQSYGAQGIQSTNGFDNVGGAGQLQQLGPAAQQQGNLNFNPNYSQSYDASQFSGVDAGSAPQYQTSYIDDFSADRQRVEDSLNANLDRQHTRDQQALEDRLANQGIQLGSSAYTRALEDFQNAKDRSRIDANLAAGQEQSRLAGLSQAQAQFGNQARSQGFNDALSLQNFNNNATGQNNALAQAQAQFGNQVQSQQFNDELTRQQFGNQASQANFDNQQRQIGFNNDTQNQGFQNQLQATGFNNNNQQQQFGNDLQAAGFNNALSRDQAQFGNDARAQSYNFGNQADLQNNNVRQQSFDNFNQATGTNNQLSQQAYDNYVNRIGLNNSATQQNNSNNAAQAGFNNQAISQLFNQGLAGAQFQEQQRNAALQEQLTLRNQPLNEIASILTGTQVSLPQQLSTPGTNIPTTDYAGLVQNDFNNQFAQFQAQQNQFQSALGGLFGLGSTALLSDRRLKDIIRPLAKLKNGLTTYLFRYKGETIERVGLMAQEVLKVNPDAVSITPSGYYAVNYERAVK